VEAVKGLNTSTDMETTTRPEVEEITRECFSG
jgi:hypothetical protein